jgi:hypothetical protein
MADQLPLRYDETSFFEHWYRRLLRELSAVTTVVGLKEMAFACDAKASVLSNALAERDQRQFQARWLGAYLYRAPDLELARVLVEPGAVDVARTRRLTPEEELAKLREAIGEVCGPMLLQAIQQRVRR